MIRFACTKCGCGFASANLLLMHNCREAYLDSRRKQLIGIGAIKPNKP